MKRQSSILSFLKKPSPEDQRSGGATLNGNQPTHLQHNKNAPPPAKCAVLPSTLDLTEEPKGTDTPPEKVPRQIFPTNDDDSGTKPSVFDSIKHKFVKFHNGEKFPDRYFVDKLNIALHFANFEYGVVFLVVEKKNKLYSHIPFTIVGFFFSKIFLNRI